MIDPSLLLARTKAKRTLDLVARLKEYRYEFYLSKSFLEFLSAMDDKSWRGYFARFYGVFPTERFDLFSLIQEHRQLFTIFEVHIANKDAHHDFFESLSLQLRSREREDKFLLNTLLEEWVFLQQHSWIVSRVRKPFNRFIDAGSACLHLGKEVVDKLERRTLHTGEDHPLSNLSHLRAFGKWAAIGGDSVLFLFNPLMSVLAGLTIKGFLLLDPASLRIPGGKSRLFSRLHNPHEEG